MLALSVSFGVTSLVEGTTLPTASVSRTGSTAASLVVTLASGDTTNATVPATVTIAAGQASASFTVTAVADGVADESSSVSISATASGHALTSSPLTIVNGDVLALRPGATGDAITLTPNGQVRRFDVGGATPEYWGPAAVDLTADSLADQRTALGLAPGNPYQTATSLIKVNPTLKYVIGGDASASNVSVDDRPLAFVSYDVDQLVIESVHVARYELAVDTTLAAPLMPGATSLLVTNASGWSNDIWESGSTRAIAWYGYSDSTGFVYADYTYTRNVATGGSDGLWAAGGIRWDAGAGAYRIDLLAPWSGPSIAAGAAIRNAQAAEQLSFPKATSTAGTGSAVKYAATVGGALWQNGVRNEASFRPGTAYIRPATSSLATWAGASIAPQSDAALGPLSFTLPVAQSNTELQVALDFDVLAKNAFGPGANVVIDSVATPQHGTAINVAGPAGRNVIHYTSTPSYFGADVIDYVLRNTMTNATFAGKIDVVVEDNSDEQRLAKLKSISLGMWNYESATNRFPIAPTASNFDGAGNPYLSWRVHILPYIGYQTLYNQFRLNEPWNSAHNLPLANQMPAEFRDPLAAASATTTRFRIISGEGDEYYWDRSNGLLAGPRYLNVGDDMKHTLMVVETGPSAAITWTQPDLPNFDPASPLSALGTLTSDWIHAVTFSGETISFPATISPTLFKGMVTLDGNELVDIPTLRREYAALSGPTGVAALDSQLGDLPLRELYLGMANYAVGNPRYPIAGPTGGFDAEGHPKLSWRVHLLPYIGYRNLFAQFRLDEPWDSPNNLALLPLMPDVFRSPGDGVGSSTTRVQTFTGPAAPFGFRTDGDSQLGPSIAEIVDGFENTIMLVETGASAAVPWTKPADVLLDTSNPLAALGNLGGASFRTVMFDGKVRHFSTGIAAPTLAALATRAGREAVNAASHTVGGTLVSTANNLKQIVLGMIDAQFTQNRFLANRFAADGTPLLSWRVRVLPYLGLTALYNQFHLNEPWDSPHNLSLLKYMPAAFRSAGDPLDTTLTHVMTFVGPGAPFPATGTSSTQGPTLSQITDGSSATYMLVEAGADVAVPWTKPVDLRYYPANPYSQLGDIGASFYAAYFDGAVRTEPTSLTISQLSSRITHQGGSSGNTPPAAPYIRQSHGDARLGEFGADWFDVVLDAAPATPLTLPLSISNPGAALLDKTSLAFNATNWNIPQRVIVRGVDDHEVNADRTVTVTVGALQFTATIVNNDLPPSPADFNGDARVDGHDFLAWQRGLGIVGTAIRADGDADGDGAVDGDDLAAWGAAFGEITATESSVVAASAPHSVIAAPAAATLEDMDAVDAALTAFAAQSRTTAASPVSPSRGERSRAFAAPARLAYVSLPAGPAYLAMASSTQKGALLSRVGDAVEEPLGERSVSTELGSVKASAFGELE